MYCCPICAIQCTQLEGRVKYWPLMAGSGKAALSMCVDCGFYQATRHQHREPPQQGGNLEDKATVQDLHTEQLVALAQRLGVPGYVLCCMSSRLRCFAPYFMYSSRQLGAHGKLHLGSLWNEARARTAGSIYTLRSTLAVPQPPREPQQPTSAGFGGGDEQQSILGSVESADQHGGIGQSQRHGTNAPQCSTVGKASTTSSGSSSHTESSAADPQMVGAFFLLYCITSISNSCL
jgi:hypothetical protein